MLFSSLNEFILFLISFPSSSSDKCVCNLSAPRMSILHMKAFFRRCVCFYVHSSHLIFNVMLARPCDISHATVCYLTLKSMAEHYHHLSAVQIEDDSDSFKIMDSVNVSEANTANVCSGNTLLVACCRQVRDSCYLSAMS